MNIQYSDRQTDIHADGQGLTSRQIDRQEDRNRVGDTENGEKKSERGREIGQTKVNRIAC